MNPAASVKFCHTRKPLKIETFWFITFTKDFHFDVSIKNTHDNE